MSSIQVVTYVVEICCPMIVPFGHFHGESQFSRTITGFELTEIVYAAGAIFPKHAHEHASFSMLFAGGLTENYNDHRQRLDWRPLFCAFNPAGEEHSNAVHSTGARCFVVDIGRKWIDRARENSVRLESSVLLRGKVFERIGLGLYHEALRFDEVSPLAVEGLVLNMLAEASRSGDSLRDTRPPRWLRRASELLNERFAESITIKMLADEVGVHPVTVSSAFSKHYGCTVGNYVRRLRIGYACRRLVETDVPLAEIALAAGFWDQSHFSRLFKDFTGVSPAQYRSNCDRAGRTVSKKPTR